jgi:hypothetical protein
MTLLEKFQAIAADQNLDLVKAINDFSYELRTAVGESLKINPGLLPSITLAVTEDTEARLREYLENDSNPAVQDISVNVFGTADLNAVTIHPDVIATVASQIYDESEVRRQLSYDSVASEEQALSNLLIQTAGEIIIHGTAMTGLGQKIDEKQVYEIYMRGTQLYCEHNSING